MAKKPAPQKKKTAETFDPNASLINMNSSVVPVDDIAPNTYNYNKQSAFIYEKTIQSIKTYGFVDPIIVRSGDPVTGMFERKEIIGGEHRYQAAIELGMKTVPINDLGVISDSKAKALCIILNETKGKPDQDALAALIASLSEDGADLSVLPYDESEIESFIDLVHDGLGDFDGDEDDDFSDGSDRNDPVKKETLIAVMGLLEISDSKERFLIEQFRSAMVQMNLVDKPVRLIEKMLEMATN